MSHHPIPSLRRDNPVAGTRAFTGHFSDSQPAVVIDPVNDRIIHVNDNAADLLGYARDSLDGAPASSLFGEAGIQLLTGLYGRMVATGRGMVWGQELTINDAFGRSAAHYCTLRLPPERDDEIPEESRQIISLDTGESTQNPGLDTRFVVEAMQDNLYEYDRERRVFFYNKSMAGILGWSGVKGGRGLTLDDWMNAVHPEDTARISHHWRMLIKDGAHYRLTYRVRDTHGEWRWVTSGIHAIFNDPQGRPQGVLGFHVDITTAMNMEKASIDTGELFQTIFNNVGVGIAVCDASGVIHQANPTLAHVLRQTREDLVGRTLESMAHPEDAQDFIESRIRLSRVGRRESLLDKRIIRADGSEIWVNVTATLSSRVLGRDRYLIAIVEDVTEARAEREKLQYEATHDVMTGGWNRWVLIERLEQHIRISQRHKLSMAFCICDLDHFKNINDLHGHLVGDQVLIRFVQLLRDAVRETEVVGRYGGEEFAIVFPGTSVAGAHLSLERALANLRRERFINNEGAPFRVTATFGISGATRDCTARQVVSWADEALYAGKEAGRNRIVVARPPNGQKWL